MKRKDNPNILKGPFSCYYGEIQARFMERYKDYISPDQTKINYTKHIHGGLVDCYYKSRNNMEPYKTEYEEKTVFPVTEHEQIHIKFVWCSSRRNGTARFKAMVCSYREDLPKPKHRRRWSGGMHEKIFLGTEQTFNLEKVFAFIDNTREHLIEKEHDNKSMEKIKEIEKIHWDGVIDSFQPKTPEERFESFLSTDKSTLDLYKNQYSANYYPASSFTNWSVRYTISELKEDAQTKKEGPSQKAKNELPLLPYKINNLQFRIEDIPIKNIEDIKLITDKFKQYIDDFFNKGKENVKPA